MAILNGRNWARCLSVFISFVVCTDIALDGGINGSFDSLISVLLILSGFIACLKGVRFWYREQSRNVRIGTLEKVYVAILVCFWAYMVYAVFDQDRISNNVIDVVARYEAGVNELDEELTVDKLTRHCHVVNDVMNSIDVSGCPLRFQKRFVRMSESLQQLIAELENVRLLSREVDEKFETPWMDLAIAVAKGAIAGWRAFRAIDTTPIEEAREWAKNQDERIYQERKSVLARYKDAVDKANHSLIQFRECERAMFLQARKNGYRGGW